MVRIKGGCLAEIVDLPDGHEVPTFEPLITDDEFINFLDPDGKSPPPKLPKRLSITKQPLP